MCVHIAQLMNHTDICYKPLGILQNQKVDISIHDGLKKIHNINLALHISHGFPLYTKLLKQLAYLSLTDNYHLFICASGEDRMKKITSI